MWHPALGGCILPAARAEGCHQANASTPGVRPLSWSLLPVSRPISKRVVSQTIWRAKEKLVKSPYVGCHPTFAFVVLPTLLQTRRGFWRSGACQINSFELTTSITQRSEAIEFDQLVTRALLQVEALELLHLTPNLPSQSLASLGSKAQRCCACTHDMKRDGARAGKACFRMPSGRTQPPKQISFQHSSRNPG
jgi:hypothetical protein